MSAPLPDVPSEPQVTVVDGSGALSQSTPGLLGTLTDGTASGALGGVLAGGAAFELVRALAAGEHSYPWWLLAVLVVGITLLGLGLRQRAAARRRVRVGIVVTLVDAARGEARAAQLDQQAQGYCRDGCEVTLRVAAGLAGAPQQWGQVVTRLADATLSAATLADRLTPAGSRVNLVPTMPLHAGFRFGARLGHAHARELMVHAVHRDSGDPPYFPAVLLRTSDTDANPLVVAPAQRVEGTDSTRAAVALDLQGLGNRFTPGVLAACRRDNIGWILWLRVDGNGLTETFDVYTAVVAQTCRAWRDAAVPDGVRAEPRAVFLSGPLAIAVALGAELAATEPKMWLPYAYDGQYQPFPS